MLQSPEFDEIAGEEPVEPFSILNPYGLSYKFLFRMPYEEPYIGRALKYVEKWVHAHDWYIHKQKQRDWPQHQWFEISVWLKSAQT